MIFVLTNVEFEAILLGVEGRKYTEKYIERYLFRFLIRPQIKGKGDFIMAYEKKTGFVELEKLENDSEMLNVQGGTYVWVKSFCLVQTHIYRECFKAPLTGPIDPLLP